MKEKKLRVLFTTNIPSSYRVNFFNELGKKVDLTVIFEQKNAVNRESSWHNYNFKNFNAVFLRSTFKTKDNKLSFEIKKYLKKDLFDVFVVGGYSTPTGMLAIQTLKNRNIPFVLSTDGGIIRKDNLLKYLLKKHFISSADFWLSTGERTSAYLSHYGAKKERIYVYPFTSLMERDVLQKPVSRIQKEKIKKSLGVKEEKVVLSVGSFIYRKGFDVLLKAAKGLGENVGVYIIGGKASKEHIELKDSLELANVHFVEFKPSEILKEYYLASDLFVLPTREDIWGLVINEALGAGLPIITTDKCVAGIELIKNDENGYIVPVENSDKLNEKMKSILSDDKKLSKMSLSSLNKINNYTIENMALKHFDIFKDIHRQCT